ncbi:glycosyltransferase family 2 protein [Dyella sp.]|uniref:glycosyltransferase family 2 protein n=1 Tax=Dyella sp. TaxID=1869338 RepID=UPI002B4A958E|nr:glycosyltransferase family 2 protein [Dyella sp.]HKT29176.1 glycosyltransferase family 2 protein [Dyella sp.]
MEHPTVSIILPTYNRLAYLREAVASVFVQTYDDWEMIIADDGSSEETCAYLRGIADPRVTVLWLSHTGIPSIARNQAIRRARGYYLAFLDSDDQWRPAKLAVQLDALRASPDCRWSYTAVDLIDADGYPVARDGLAPWVPYAGDITERILWIQAHIAIDAVIAERSMVLETGGFDEHQRFAEDYDLYIRLAMRSPANVVNTPLAVVRAGNGENYSANRIEAYAGWVQLYEKYAATLPSKRLRAIARRRRAENLLILARLHIKAGQPGAAWRTLLHGTPGALLAYPPWAWRAAKELARACFQATRRRA